MANRACMSTRLSTGHQCRMANRIFMSTTIASGHLFLYLRFLLIFVLQLKFQNWQIKRQKIEKSKIFAQTGCLVLNEATKTRRSK